MFLLKLVLKIVALPIIILLTVLQWIAMLVSGLITGILVQVVIFILLVAVMFAFTGTGGAGDIKELLIAAGIAFFVPIIAGRCTNLIGDVRIALCDFLRS